MTSSNPGLRPSFSRAGRLRRWESVLGRHVDAADTVLTDTRRRIPDLAQQVPAPSPTARRHLEDAILPGAALYLELRERFGQEHAYALTAACFAASAEREGRVFRLLDRTPWLYPILRRWGKRMMRRAYSPPEFQVRWVEDTPQQLRFDMTRCYYLDTLTTLGVPELTSLYCHSDELMYGDLEHLRFVRAGTLAQGRDRCDFCFERCSGRASGATGASSRTAP